MNLALERMTSLRYAKSFGYVVETVHFPFCNTVLNIRKQVICNMNRKCCAFFQIISQKDEHCWVGELNGLRGELNELRSELNGLKCKLNGLRSE